MCKCCHVSGCTTSSLYFMFTALQIASIWISHLFSSIDMSLGTCRFDLPANDRSNGKSSSIAALFSIGFGKTMVRDLSPATQVYQIGNLSLSTTLYPDWSDSSCININPRSVETGALHSLWSTEALIILNHCSNMRYQELFAKLMRLN